jgi:uncharacterized protein (TIGR00369 family)
MSSEILEKINGNPLPFAATLNILFTVAGPDRVVAEMVVSKELCTAGDVVHGGALMALADTVGGMATFINLPSGATGTTTIESKSNFLGAAPRGELLIASASPLHKGRRTQVWQTRIELGSRKLVAVVTQTQLVID